ncbi:hypothetical protein [Treponema sp.]|uniref:hypothetical protein n=1 Tax=Treponema sp. TaxID=166 RepID=UPI003FA257F3
MEFDKSKVYTAVNADKLKVGSQCIFADTLKGLHRQVKDIDAANYVQILVIVDDDQFVGNYYTHAYDYAYLVKPPAEPKYKPFSSEEKAIEIIEQHECWIKSKMTQNCFLVGRKDSKHIPLIGYDCKEFFSLLLDGYVFADDGSPCGELVED